MTHEARRSRSEAIEAKSSRHAQPVPGRRTLTGSPDPAPASTTTDPSPLPSLQLGRKDTRQKAAAPKAEDAEQEKRESLGSWAGAGVSGQIFHDDTSDTFVDGSTGDAVEVRTDWMLAEHESFELHTNALLAVERAIQIRLARGVSVLAKSRARAWFHADRLPNDPSAALYAPARLIKHW